MDPATSTSIVLILLVVIQTIPSLSDSYLWANNSTQMDGGGYFAVKARCSGTSKPRRKTANTPFMSPRSNAAVSSHTPGKMALLSRPSAPGAIS